MVVGFVALVAVLARFVGLLHQSTIPDEAFTIWLAAHPIADVLRLLKSGDFHPPLAYLLAHALLAITPKAFLFRSIAAAFGVAGVIATYFVATRVVGRFAWLPALLTAICPILVYFDRFYRMYALLGALCVLSWLLLLRGLEAPRKPWRWIGYAALLAIMLYTHYLAFFTLAAQAIYVLATRRGEWRFWLALGAAVVCWLPWLPAFLEQLPKGGTAFNAVSGFSDRYILPAVVLTDGLPAEIEFNTAYVALLWLVLAGAVVVAALRPAYRLALWLLLPVALQAAYSLFFGKNLLSQRYLLNDIFALNIALSVPIAALAASRWRALGAAVGAGLVVLMSAGTIDKLFVAKYKAVDWKIYANFLGERMAAGDVIVFNDSAPWFALSDSPVLARHKVFAVSNPKMAERYVTQVGAYPRVWYVDYQSQFSDPHHLIFRELLRTHPRTRSWISTEAGYQDFVITTLFTRP